MCSSFTVVFVASLPQVAAVSGDARRALDIARRATEIAQLEKGVGLIGIPHIDRAVQEMFSSAKIQAIR
jgi:origin recognition complex subunit 1